MLCSDEIYQTIAKGLGFFQHGHTYIGHQVASAAALSVVKALINRNLFGQVQHRGAGLENALRAQFEQHENIGDIRGLGRRLFGGIELVADRATKSPLDPSLETAKKSSQQRLKGD